MAYTIDVSPALHDEFAERQAVADRDGTGELRFGGLRFALKRSRRLHFVSFQNADLRCVFDDQASGGWVLEVVVRAVFLATHALGCSISLADRVAGSLGQVKATRLRRVDICADLVGFPLLHDDVNRIVSYGRPNAFIPESKDFDEPKSAVGRPRVREHRSRNLEVTGFTVAPGNSTMARVYNKTIELSLAGREQKREIEHEIWQRNGWDGVSPVTRVEFQFRGEALDELAMRDPYALESKIDGLWQTGVRWLRLVVPDSATRPARRKLDPRWQVATNIIFNASAQPIKRRRVRGGATPEQAMGATRNCLAALRQLPRLELITHDGEVLHDELAFANSLTEAQALDFIRRYLRRTSIAFSREFAAKLVELYRPNGAVQRLVVLHNAAAARFSSIDDEATDDT